MINLLDKSHPKNTILTYKIESNKYVLENVLASKDIENNSIPWGNINSDMIFICKNFKKYEDFIFVTCQSLSNNINLIQYSILVFKLTNGIPIYLKKINNILNDSKFR